MLIECKRCAAIVDAPELYAYDAYDERDGLPERWTFAKCPRCASPLLAVQCDYGNGFEEDTPTRVFPARDRQLGASVPRSIRVAFDEATVCFRAKAYTASAIMCRKTLEGLCAEHEVKERNLSASLKKLKDIGVIEIRLFEWAEALRTLGNEAAHGVTSVISPQDAKDILGFTEAISEYLFTYKDQFERFKKRRAESNKD